MRNALFVLLILIVFVFAGSISLFSNSEKLNVNAFKIKNKENFKYFLYVSKKPNESNLPVESNVLNLGFAYEIKTKKVFAYDDEKSVLGFSFSFKGNQNDLNCLIDQTGIRIFEKYFINQTCVFEGEIRTGFLEKTKVQIAFFENRITLGSPVIFGSY